MAKKKKERGRPSVYGEPTILMPIRLPESIVAVADSLVDPDGFDPSSRSAALIEMLKQSPQYRLSRNG